MTVIIGGDTTLSSKTKHYTIKTFPDYINRIGRLTSQYQLFFRGLSNEKYPLVPSLDRGIDGEGSIKWITKEFKLVEFSEQRFPESFVKNTPALLIANMQHYGIPTRMMDVTGNALVALYFACDNKEKNGQVVVFDEKIVSAYNPFANIIADTYRITQNAPMDLQFYRYLIYKQPYSSSLIYPNWENEENETMDKVLFDCISRPMVVDVGAVNQRQINQDGKFILFPNRIIKSNEKDCIGNQLLTIEKESSFVKAIIDVPKESKEMILKQLRLAGIKRDFLFPDDTGVVCEEIKQMIKCEETV